MSSAKRKKHASYDRQLNRFRDARGRFLSRSRGLKSKYARMTYLRVIAKPKAPRKAPPPPIRIIKSKKGKPKSTRLSARKTLTKPRAKSKPKPKFQRPAPKPVKFPKKIPGYYQRSVKGASGQQMINGIGSWSIGSLAALLLKQIHSGYIRFRFWYKIVKTGFIYTDTTVSGSKIGSTHPLMWSKLTLHKTFDEIIDFLRGRDNYINGKVIYYWCSKRF